MDFGSLLYKAQRNEQNTKQNGGWYKTTFAPPKKETREKKLSSNIQKFLAKKEEEEKRQRMEAAKKKQELVAYRNKDKKSYKRVKSMLTKTKSANKSVLEDAVDNVNTAVTANGPLQPDEDDYGYVSKDAEELYNKLINKYSSMPADDPFSKSSSKCSKDMSGTKDRVKAALQKEEEEKFLPRKRKRKSKTGDGEDDKSDDDEKNHDRDEKGDEGKSHNKPEKFKIPKKRAPQPPPIDFQSLLQLAEKKQHEPIVIEKKVEEKPDRPMTEKEKQEYLREKERRLRKEMGISESAYRANEMKKKTIKSKSEVTEKSLNNERLKNSSESSAPSGILKKSLSESSSQKLKNPSNPKKPKPEEVKPEVKEQKTPEKSAIGVLSERQKMILAHKRNSELETRRMAELEARRKEARMAKINQSKEIPRERLPNPPSNSSLKSIKSEVPPSKLSKTANGNPMPSKNVSFAKPAQAKRPASSGVQSRQFPPPDLVARQFPPPDVVRKKPNPKPVMRRKFIESDEEYDSEMDDFIDDTEDPNDVSSYISEIFGYDRKKYATRDYEDEDECMESNFSELQKEEFMSTKYGILEDLEDVRRTKLEKMRKKKRTMS